MRCRQEPDYIHDLGPSIGKLRRAESDNSESIIGSLLPSQGGTARTDAEIEALARELVGNSAWNLPGEAHE